MSLKPVGILLFALLVIFFSSCASVDKIAYFQDLEPGVAERATTPLEIRVRPHDKMSIVVNSKDAELSNLFNLPIVSNRVGMSSLRLSRVKFVMTSKFAPTSTGGISTMRNSIITSSWSVSPMICLRKNY